MKKLSILFVILAIVFSLTCPLFAFASATATTHEEVFVGEYDSGDLNGVCYIVFGTVSDPSLEYGIVLTNLDTEKSYAYKGKCIGNEGKFGIALYSMPEGVDFEAKAYSGDPVTGVFGESVSFSTHQHEFTLEIALDKYLATPATCEAKATYFYSCSCGAVGDDAFMFGDFADHSYENGVCGVCGLVCEHVFDEGVFNSSSKKTTYTCSVCSYEKVEAGLPNRESELVVTNAIEPDEGEVEYKYYKYKVYVDKSVENRFIERREEKTHYEKGNYNLFQSSNSSDFKYIGTFYPMNLYETATLFEMDMSCVKAFGTAEFNTRNFNRMIHNFIRFIYICTDGDLELSFEYDTSFMYGCKNLSYGIRGRFNVESCADGMSYNTIRELLLSAYSGSQTYLDVYKGMMNMQIEFLSNDDTTTGLNVGDYSWCDICVEIPLLNIEREDSFWSFMLTNSGMMGY
ncbi:MAG: hypothetical protein IJF76_00075 [Clostridia bacterium]|nr:hypothetical protein [Clostridia bacterium]